MPIGHNEIIDLIEEKSLIIEPFDLEQIGGFTISLRIGTQFLRYGEVTAINLTKIGDPITLQSHQGVSIVSLEAIKLPLNLSGMVNLRSSFQRDGLIMNSSFVDPGYQGKLIFGLLNISPQAIQLFAGQRIALLALFRLNVPVDYIPKYIPQVGPSFSRLYDNKEFVKLRNILAHSADKIKVRTETESVFEELLRSALTANAKEKGKLLERFTKEILATIKGLKILKVDARLRAEEIDFMVQNNVSEGFWRTLGSPIIVECKNWNKKVGAKEISILADKMKTISPDVKLGILIATNGVSGDYQSNGVLKIREKRQQGSYIVVLTKEDLEEIASGTHAAEVIEKKYNHLFLI